MHFPRCDHVQFFDETIYSLLVGTVILVIRRRIFPKFLRIFINGSNFRVRDYIDYINQNFKLTDT